MSRHKLHSFGEAESDTEVEWRVLEEIKRLETMSITDLKAKLTTLTGREAPRFAKRSLLTQLIAWRLQANAYGGLDPVLRRQLLAMGGKGKASSNGEEVCSRPPALRPGVKLLRSWKGVTHHVTVTNGGFSWQDRTYKSLSVIAREITGDVLVWPGLLRIEEKQASWCKCA